MLTSHHIKHISFDMWNTLISANPIYAKLRNEYYVNKYNLDPIFVKETYTRVKNELDAINIRCHSVESCHNILGQQLGVTHFDIVDSIRMLRKLFKQHQPVVLPDTISMLKRLHQHGYTISIGSNTNFISGHVLDITLVDDWSVPFAFVVYSDLLGTAKPNAQFFNHISRLARQIHPDLRHNEVLHIGDNAKCDSDGAQLFGFKALLIDNPLHLTQVIGKLL